jgi:hypothetical protein
MPTVDDLKDSNFITQKDVDPPILVTIESWEKTNIAKEGADPEIRFCLRFKGHEKPMTLNVTNGNIIASIVGSRDFDDWPGHIIVLYRDPNVSFAGKIVGGIRVRAPKPGYSKQQQLEEPEPEPPIDDDIPF